jgi:hypothetical protein
MVHTDYTLGYVWCVLTEESVNHAQHNNETNQHNQNKCAVRDGDGAPISRQCIVSKRYVMLFILLLIVDCCVGWNIFGWKIFCGTIARLRNRFYVQGGVPIISEIISQNKNYGNPNLENSMILAILAPLHRLY